MMNIRIIFNLFIAFFLALGFCLCLLLTTNRYKRLLCTDIKINIDKDSHQPSLTEETLISWIDSSHSNLLVGHPLQQIDSYKIQQKLISHPLIEQAIVFKTWEGVVTITLKMKQLLARLILPMEPHAVQTYIDDTGHVLSLKGCSMHLLVIVGDHSIRKKGEDLVCTKPILTLLDALYKDPFFRHQIVSMQVSEHDKITLGTQVGSHTISFGRAEKISSKLEKLRLFYKQIIPYKGWKAYRHINVEFDNQIICSP